MEPHRRTILLRLFALAAVVSLALLWQSPAPVAAANAFVSIDSGASHACGVVDGGGARCWGSNVSGQLGNGTTVSSSAPVDVCADSTCASKLTGITAVAAAALPGGAERAFSCALTTAGGVKCWGENEFGYLGDGTAVDSLTPVDVVGLSSGVEAISSYGTHTCALMAANGALKCWGANGFGQLGDGTSVNIRTTPVDVCNIGGCGAGLLTAVAEVAAGTVHTCAIVDTDRVACWGNNGWDQLGNDQHGVSQAVPVYVCATGATFPCGSSALTGVTSVASGNYYTCAVMLTTSVKCWGYNGCGQLGNGRQGGFMSPSCPAVVAVGQTADESTPVDVCAIGVPVPPVPEFPDPPCAPGGANDVLSGVASVQPGFWHTCAVMTSGKATCWGWNDYGQIGDGTLVTRVIPVEVCATGQWDESLLECRDGGVPSPLTGVDITTKPAVAFYSSCLLMTAGAVQCFGENDGGQLGNTSADVCPDEPCSVNPVELSYVSGIYDVLVYLTNPLDQAFYCKTRIDHDPSADGGGGAEAVDATSVCISDTPGQAAAGSKIPADPNIDLSGPPPPPPYGSAGPQTGSGSYCPPASGGCTDVLGQPMAEDQTVIVTCFESLGGTLGPNVIWVMRLDDLKSQPAGPTRTVDIYFGQGIDDCNALTPFGDPTQTLPVQLTPTSEDSDSDGCPDSLELDENRALEACGDDPWNPHDSDDNYTGTYSITVEVKRADTCPGTAGPPPIGCTGAAAGDTVAGSYFNCQAYLDHDQGDNSITGAAFCYTDNPVTTVNIEDNGGAIVCAPFPSANPGDCGDGLPGSPPPGPFGDNDGVTTPGVITGQLDKATNRISLDVCFSGLENPTEGPSLYMRLDVDAHTMLGTADIWLQQSDCVKPIGPPDADDVGVALGEQNNANCSFTTSNPTCYDIDQDGCSARQELGTNEFQGGQRDPFNKYDHMDMNKDGTINIPDDITIVAGLFGPSTKGVQGNVGPRMTGSVAWAHRNGDDAIGIPDDILGMAAQFGHNCQ